MQKLLFDFILNSMSSYSLPKKFDKFSLEVSFSN